MAAKKGIHRKTLFVRISVKSRKWVDSRVPNHYASLSQLVEALIQQEMRRLRLHPPGSP